MPTLFDPLSFQHGPAMKNRFMLAPLTNLQSHVDGTLSDDEYQLAHDARARRLRTDDDLRLARAGDRPGLPGPARAAGPMRTCRGSPAWPPGIKAAGSVAHVQLHHAGMRSPRGPDRVAAGVPIGGCGNRLARA